MTVLSGGYQPVRPSPLATLREVGAFVRYRFQTVELEAAAAGAAAAGPRGAVLVIPTLLRGDRQTRLLRAALRRAGYRAFGWGLGTDFGPTPELIAGAEARLLALSDAYGPVSLVGLSMGGLFCRWLALRHPERVRQVVTVCSPYRAPLDSFFLPLQFAVGAWPLPNLRAMAAELETDLPVPGTYIYSRQDGVVASASCCDPKRPEDCFAIDSPHVAIASDPAVRAIVLARLGRVD